MVEVYSVLMTAIHAQSVMIALNLDKTLHNYQNALTLYIVQVVFPYLVNIVSVRSATSVIKIKLNHNHVHQEHLTNTLIRIHANHAQEVIAHTCKQLSFLVQMDITQMKLV